MFHLSASSSSAQAAQEQRQGKSTRHVQSQRFIPPTHPVYVVTANFEAAHILQLQQECDRHYIAMGMQTGRKKLMRIPDTPHDRFFIVQDDSAPAAPLEGEFLTLPARVVRFPHAHSLQQVIAAFQEYIGLGHYQTKDQYFEHNENALAAQATQQQTTLQQKTERQQQTALSSLVANLNRSDAIHSVLTTHTSRIELREVSSLRVESRITRGRLFVYDNRKDSAEYKSLVSEMRGRFSSGGVRFIERIDEYNSEVRASRQHDNVVLMTHHSFLTLARYFAKLRSFALFLQQGEAIDLHLHKHVTLATPNKHKIFAFAEAFLENHSKLIGNEERHSQASQPRKDGTASEMKNNPNSIGLVSPASEEIRRPDARGGQESGREMRLKSVSPAVLPASPNPRTKSQIQLVRVSDLDKNTLQKLKVKPKQLPAELKQPKPVLTPIHPHDSSQGQLMKQEVLQPSPYAQPPNQQKQHAFRVQTPKVQAGKQAVHGQLALIPEEAHLSQLIMGALDDVSFDRSQYTKKSKIKRLKSAKKLNDRPELSCKSQQEEIMLQEQLPPRKSNNSVKGHLRMGSDDHNSRSKERLRPAHSRAHSETENAGHRAPTINVRVPPPVEGSEPNDYYSLLPEEDEKCMVCPAKPPAPPSNSSNPSNQVSIALPARVPTAQESPDRNIITSNPVPKQKDRDSMAQKIGRAPSDNDEVAVVRKPKAHLTLKERQKQTFKKQTDAQKDLEQLCMAGALVPKDEVELHRLRDKMKVQADEYNIAHRPKVMRAIHIPPTFQTNISSEQEQNSTPDLKESAHPEDNYLSNAGSHLDSKIEDFETPAISNISSIRPRTNSKPAEPDAKGKRFTFGIEENQRTAPRKSTHPPEPPKQHQQEQECQYGLETPAARQEEQVKGGRLAKSKSMQQVRKVFNKYRSKLAEESRFEPKGEDDAERPPASQMTARHDNPKVGKIYSNLKCKAARSAFDAPLSDLPPLSPRVDHALSTYEHYRNKGIEELIDLEKYDKVVENGVTVYRSKFPIRVTHYSPTSFPPSVSAAQPIFREIPSNTNPYLLGEVKPSGKPKNEDEELLRRSKSGVVPLARYSPRGTENQASPKNVVKTARKVTPCSKNTTDSVGVQCQADPFNSLVNTNNQDLMSKLSHPLPKSSKVSSSKVTPYDPTRKLNKSPNPIQDMLASKLSNSSQSPPLILHLQSPLNQAEPPLNLDRSHSSSSSLSLKAEPDQKLVLYLLDKSQAPPLFEQLSGVKSRRDSLLTFRSQKQLAQQLLQAVSIYDLVYVIPSEPTRTIEKLTKRQENCYLVEVRPGETKLKGNRVMLSSLRCLSDVTELLLKSRGRAKSGVNEKSYCFSPSPSYFVPSCCRSAQACHCQHPPCWR